MALGMAATFAYFQLMGDWREPLLGWVRQQFGETAAAALPIALVLPAFAILLTTCWLVDRIARCNQIACPQCKADMSRSARGVLATLCCRSCGVQVIEGEPPTSPRCVGSLLANGEPPFSRLFVVGMACAWADRSRLPLA